MDQQFKKFKTEHSKDYDQPVLSLFELSSTYQLNELRASALYS